MKPFEQMNYHPTAEQLVQILRDRTQANDSLFFRLMVGYYFSLAASQMRCFIKAPDRGGDVPINMYVLNLAPSGYGKTMSMNLMEKEILGLFRHRFIDETFPLLVEANLPKISLKRANRKGTDPDEELVRVQKEFDATGEMPFSFSAGTTPAVRQVRHKMLMANSGSLNLIMDEVGANLTSNMDLFNAFIELYDKGEIKGNLLKNSAENQRNAEILGATPANLLMFGVPQRLFDGAKTEEDVMTMFEMGYSRRCFFGYVRDSGRREGRTAESMYHDRTNATNSAVIDALSNQFEVLADMVNANKALTIKESTSIMLNEYQLNCEERADRMPEQLEMQRRELSERSFKVLKLAGAYAFIDDSPEVTEEHIYNAIKLAEDSGDAFIRMLNRDKPYVRLAKYIASIGQEVNHADLSEALTFYKGSSGARADMITMAISYGYRNNIIIKKAFQDGIEFFRGETLDKTDLSKMVVSYSRDIAQDYQNEQAPFDQLHKLTQAQGMHWCAHHLMGGHRNEENCIPGFNLVVVDVDGGTNIETVKSLLKGYKFLIYTTKRHNDDEHRFRLILPTNYRLLLDPKDYKEFMVNIFDWLPFEVDRATGQRARKWMSHDGHYEYNEGDLLDVLPFIPKTSKNEERKQLLTSQQSMDNLERWVSNNIGDGNRNNMLLRYAMILMDAGADYQEIMQKVMALNEKIADKLDQAEILSTIMVSVGKNLAKRAVNVEP